jgi:hypothetical protein
MPDDHREQRQVSRPMEPLLACRQVRTALSLTWVFLVPSVDEECAVQQPISIPVALL